MSKDNCESDENNKNLIIKSMLDSLRSHNITHKELLNYLISSKSASITLPSCIFKQELSPLQACVKFLVENKKYTFSAISNLLNRDQRTIWNTYHSAKSLKPDLFLVEDLSYLIELSIFRNRELSFLENLCLYLKNQYSLSYHEIAIVLGKNDRTIWTVCNRAKSKNNKHEQ